MVVIDWSSTLANLAAQRAAIRQYRAAAAFHRALAEELAAGCDGQGNCAGGPCAEAYEHRRTARRCEAQAWLEEHSR